MCLFFSVFSAVFPCVNGQEGLLGIYREEDFSEHCNSIILGGGRDKFQFQISYVCEDLSLTDDKLIAMAGSVQMQEN